MTRTAAESPRKRPWPRRIERALLGGMMGIIAFVIERRVLKAIRKGGKKPAPDAGHAPLEGGLGQEGLAVSPKKVDE
jgi:hypothetical protein